MHFFSRLSSSFDEFESSLSNPEPLQVSSDEFADVLQVESAPSVDAFVSTGFEPSFSIDSFTEASGDISDASVSTTPSEPGLLDRLKKIGENLLDSVKTTAEASVRGAIEGGTVASEGAATGSQIGASTTGLNATLLLALGVVVLVILLRK